MATAPPGIDAPQKDGFAAWLGSPVLHVVVTTQHGQWYASAEDLGIVGMGNTRETALRDLAGLSETYLRSYYTEGRPYEEALRTSSGPRRPWDAVAHLAKQAVGRLTGRNSDLVVPGALQRPNPAL